MPKPLILGKLLSTRPFISNDQAVSLRQVVELVHDRPQDFRVKWIVEVHERIVLHEIEFGGINAMDCETFRRQWSQRCSNLEGWWFGQNH